MTNTMLTQAMYYLYAERDGTYRYIGRFSSMEAAADCVELSEEADVWPEGFDAVLIDIAACAVWVYASTWERV